MPEPHRWCLPRLECSEFHMSLASTYLRTALHFVHILEFPTISWRIHFMKYQRNHHLWVSLKTVHQNHPKSSLIHPWFPWFDFLIIIFPIEKWPNGHLPWFGFPGGESNPEFAHPSLPGAAGPVEARRSSWLTKDLRCVGQNGGSPRHLRWYNTMVPMVPCWSTLDDSGVEYPAL